MPSQCHYYERYGPQSVNVKMAHIREGLGLMIEMLYKLLKLGVEVPSSR